MDGYPPKPIPPVGPRPGVSDLCISSVALQKFKFLLLQELDKGVLKDCKVDISDMVRFVANTFAIRVTKEVWGSEIDLRKSFSAPADWWEHFKLRWFPAWLLNKYPVKLMIETFTFREIYPDFNPKLPNENCVIKVLKG